MSASDRSREELSIGTVFLYKRYQGTHETKDRFFVVVSTTPDSFLCFTMSTQMWVQERFPKLVVPLAPGSTCMPKECFIDCRGHYDFDDIEMSNKLNCGNAEVYGDFDLQTLRLIADNVRSNSQLKRGIRKQIIEELDAILG